MPAAAGLVAASHLWLCSLAAYLAVVSAGEGGHWGYKDDIGPAHWSHMKGFEICNGTRQSPINFVTSNMKSVKYPALRLHHYTHRPVSTFIKNNGHSLYVELTQAGMDPVMTEGGLTGDYVFHSLHFHWGSSNEQGSEHTVNGKEYPLEMHLVHSNARYGSMATAMKNPDGLAVLGVLFELSSSDNEALDELLDEAEDVTYAGDNVTLKNPDFTLRSLLPSSYSQFYRYLGSLTTPTCDEIVTWTVLETKNTVSEKQLEKLRKMKCNGRHDDHTISMSDNYRPLQKLKNRYVFRREVDSSFDSSLCLKASLLTVAAATLLSSFA